MSVTTDRTTKRWQALGALLRVVATVLVAFWVLMGSISAAFHWIIVPRLTAWKPDVERLASDWTGLKVSMQSLRADADEHGPRIALQGLLVQDDAGTEHLWVGEFEGRWSAWSLLNLGFSQAVASDWRLRVQRDANSQFTVAGLKLQSASNQSPQYWSNWLFKQPSLTATQGTITWHDGRLERAPEMRFLGVGFALTNEGVHHDWRIDAKPQGQEVSPWTLQGRMQSPLLSREAGDWAEWSGQLYWDLPGVNWDWLEARIDVSQGPLQRLRSGQGHWRAWVEVLNGQAVEVTSDVALQDLDVQLDPGLDALNARQMKGRLTWMARGSVQQLTASDVEVTLADGLRWRGGEIAWQHTSAQGDDTDFSELTLKRIDLPTVSALALRLPQVKAWHTPLQSWQPQGEVVRLKASWRESWSRPSNAFIEGEIRDLGWQAGSLPAGAKANAAARPGVKGLDVSFSTTELEGSARLNMRAGQWTLPGVWDEPKVAVDELDAALSWRKRGGLWRVEAPSLAWRNADLQTTGSVAWSEGEYGGDLDIQLNAQRARLSQLARYMPRVVSLQARDYLRQSITGGFADNVKVRIKGQVDRLPFDSAKGSLFQVEGDIEGGVFEPAPERLSGARWVRLQRLSGRYKLDRQSMSLTQVRADWLGFKGLSLSDGQANWVNWAEQGGQLTVDAKAQGPINQWLSALQSGGFQSVVQGGLDGVSASAGDGSLSIALRMPMAKPESMVVTGQFAGKQATVRVAQDLPPVSGARFEVDFSPQRTRIQVAQANLLGAPMSAKLDIDPTGAWVGVVDAQARIAEIEQWTRWPKEWRGMVTGETSVRVNLRRSAGGGAVTASVASDLAGLSIQMPAPLAKPSATRWPLKGEWRSDTRRTQWTLMPGQAPALGLLWDARSPTRKGILSWGMSIEEASRITPRAPWLVALQLPKVNADDWSAWWTTRSSTAAPEGQALSLPAIQWTSTINDLTVSGWKFQDARVDALWQNGGWQADVKAKEMLGQVSMKASDAGNPDGQIYARLQRLSLNPEVLDRDLPASDQRRGMPALDVQVESLSIRDQDWGQVKLVADNTWVQQGRRWVPSWEVKQLDVKLPEAEFKATGSWKPQATA
ncbi:MAG: hypothetical protein RL357_1077, partial [Pseudomonadota bacterium]